MGGNFPLKLNIGLRPIANKYREGKMKRTLERELKVPEIAKREANGTSFSAPEIVASYAEYWFCKGLSLKQTLVMFLWCRCHRALGDRR